MNFLVDAQLPKLISDWLNEIGHDSKHTLDLPMQNKTQDNQVRQIADQESRIVITKDSDFLESNIINGSPKQLLIINTGNIKNNQLLSLFRSNIEKICQLYKKYHVLEMDRNTITVHN